MIFIFLFLSSAFAQDMAGLFRPGPSGHSASVRESIYGDSKVRGSDTRLQAREWQGRVSGTAYRTENWEYTAGIDAQDLVFHHPSPILNPYRSFQGTLGARRFGFENKVRSMNFSYGSASDKPFARSANDFMSANYVHQFSAKWWGLVNWSTNRTFLNNVPLPGVFYISKMSMQETLLFGFPAVVWRRRWDKGLEVQLTSFIPYNHKAQVGWFWKPTTGIVAYYDHRPQVFFRDGRVSKQERLFFVESKAMLELQGSFIPRVLNYTLGVGQAFNRRLYESRNYGQSKRFDLPLGDTLLVMGQVNSQF